MDKDIRFLRLPQVLERTALSRRSLYRMIAEGRFPRQRRLSHKVAVWIESEVAAWMNQVAEEAA